MGKRAARKYDAHICPGATPGTPAVPHVGGPVTGGCLTVYIDGQPAARVGDVCFCTGEPDTIITGSSGVYIGGQPAARMGDLTAHGGKIISGCRTVLIGEMKVPRVLRKFEEIMEFSPEEKVALIDQAIEKSIILLEKKLLLLDKNDLDTLMAFKRWFGKDDEESRKIILERMRRALLVCVKLTADNFSEIGNEKQKREQYANSYPNDKDYKICLGDKFWKGVPNKRSRAGVIIHELSHFRDIGNTEDVIYGKARCLGLAKDYPSFALRNAESFEYFVVS